MPSDHWGQLRSIDAGTARVISAAGVAFEGVLTVIVSGPWQRALSSCYDMKRVLHSRVSHERSQKVRGSYAGVSEVFGSAKIVFY